MDYSAYEEAPSDDSMSELYRLVTELSDAELLVAETEKALKRAKKTVRDISTQYLPEQMEKLGLQEVTLRNGLTVKIKKEIYASLPKKNPSLYERGLEWFAKNGLGRIVKNQLVAEFGKGREEEALALAEKLRKENYSVQAIKEVHPQTIKATIKNWVEEGGEDEEAEEIFSIRRVDVAKVK